MSPTENKSKIRPQQSCLKCRERKIKCDRNIPCEACVHRGIESECTYLTSAEDRAHISQAEIIDRLRREVAQLRSQLNQSSSSARGPSPGQRDKVYVRKNKPAGFQRASYTGPATAPAPATSTGSATAGPGSGFTFGFASGPGSSGSGSCSRSATGSAEPMEGGGSWAGSSPSSTPRTNSGTVASPDSTGSESGVGGAGYIQQYAYPGSTGSYGTQNAEVNMGTATDGAAMGRYLHDDALAHYHADSTSAFAPKIPDSTSMQGLSSQHIHSARGEGLAGLPSMHMYGSRDIPGYDGDPPQAQSYTEMAHYGHDEGYNHALHEYTNTSATPRNDPAQVYHQPWGPGHDFPQQTQSQPHTQAQLPLYSNTTPASAYSTSTINTFTPADPNITNFPHLQPYPPEPSIPPSQQHRPTHSHPTTQPQTYHPPTHPTESQTHAINSIPSSWKGPDKQALLETLLETITSCDEARVAHVVAVVRNSQTPEEAVSGICRVLGIGGDTAGSREILR